VNIVRVGFVVFAIVLALAVPGHAFKEDSQSCVKCHTLSGKEMAGILEKMKMPAGKVLSIGMSPVKGLWEVDIENRGRRFVVYVDFAKKFISPGPFVDYAAWKDITREKTEALNKDRLVSVQGLSLQDALIIGHADAPARVIVFTDPACPYCAKLHAEMKTVAGKRPDIAFYLKVFAMVSRDPKVAKSIICNKSLAMLEDAFAKKTVPEKDCASKEIDDNMRFAEEHGIDAAPALIFPDGTLQLGYSDAASLEKRIDEAMANQKKKNP
jgi:thiol:disulfide interchange protein DsbC